MTQGSVAAGAIHGATFNGDWWYFRNEFNCMIRVHMLRFVDEPDTETTGLAIPQ